MQPSSARVTPALPPAVRTRLVGVLGLLGSNHDGERAAAGLLASRMLRDRGLTWDQVVTTPRAEQPGADDAGADLALCRRHVARLNAWLQAFVAGVAQQRRPLTPGQRAKLAETATSLRARGFA